MDSEKTLQQQNKSDSYSASQERKRQRRIRRKAERVGQSTVAGIARFMQVGGMVSNKVLASILRQKYGFSGDVPSVFRQFLAKYKDQIPPKIKKSRNPSCAVVVYQYQPKSIGDVASKDFLQTYEWRVLRMKALKKYGARCMCCGATPATGAVMNVDHIKPRKHFPELALELSNLQILCHECNHGKGNWDATDWRGV